MKRKVESQENSVTIYLNESKKSEGYSYYFSIVVDDNYDGSCALDVNRETMVSIAAAINEIIEHDTETE